MGAKEEEASALLQSRFPQVLSCNATADAYGGYVKVSTTRHSDGRPMEIRVSARVVPCCSDNDDDDEDGEKRRWEKDSEKTEEKEEEEEPSARLRTGKRQQHVQWEVMAVSNALVSPLAAPPTTWSAAFSNDARGGAAGTARLYEALDAFVRSAEQPATRRRSDTAALATADVCSLLDQLDAIGWANVSGVANGLNSITLEKKDIRGRRHEMEVDVRSLLLLTQRTTSAGMRRAGEAASTRRRRMNVGGGNNVHAGMMSAAAGGAIDAHNVKVALKTDVPGVYLDDADEDTQAAVTAAAAHGKYGDGGYNDDVHANGGEGRGAVVRAYAAFCDAISRHQDAWDELDVLDTSCLVLEPEKPSYATLFRRISLSRHCSMGLTVDWRRPRAIPHLYSMMGPSEVVVPLKEKMERAADAWDESQTIVVNLGRVLELDLPSSRSKRKRMEQGGSWGARRTTNWVGENKKDEGLTSSTQITSSSLSPASGGDDYDDMSCAICYQYRSPDGHPPDTSCGHARCGRPFHTSCLSEWLRSDPATKQSYNTLFGSCPYCEQKISCRVWIASS